MVLCCIPSDIVQCNIPDILDTATAVQVFCSNPFCWQSGLVHSGCFYKWEDKVVRFLIGDERNKASTDQRVMNSLLWTKQMWDLPLPSNLTACKCGEGSLKRIFDEEDFVNDEMSMGGRRPAINYSGLKEECLDEAKSDKDSMEGNWEVVSRIKQKKSSSSEKKQRRGKQTTKKKTGTQHPKAGPDPQTAHMAGQAEGRRDSSGLIHCCSCKTVHSNLPDFIQHCKTGQHSKQGLGDVNNNGKEEDIADLRTQVDHLKKGLVEIMKQGLEKDMLAITGFNQLKESCKHELKKSSATLALLIEKFQGLEEKFLKVDDDLAALSLMVKNNEKDIESYYDCCQDLIQRMTGLTKEFKSYKKNSLIAQDLFKVKINEIVESVPEVVERIPQVEEAKPMNALSICSLTFSFFFFAVLLKGSHKLRKPSP